MHRSIAACRHRIATAVSLLLCAQASFAVVEATGAFGTDPFGLAIGPGDTDLLGARFFIGNGAPGTLLVDAGSQLSSGSLTFATNGTGSASGLISGSGTRVNLTADGDHNRFELGSWGIGAVTVAAGAILDGRANADACQLGNQFCNNFIGQSAGSDGTFTVTGNGSEAYFLKDFVVGDTAVFRPPFNGFTFGTPGGTSTGRVRILDGGLLVTDYARLGRGPTNPGATGTERSFAELLVSGAGSSWRVTGGTVEGGQPQFETARGRNAWADVRVESGGSIRVGGTGNAYSSVNLTVDRGRTDAIVTGSGSNITFESQSGLLQVGQSLGSATLEVRDGARVEGMFYASVGRNGSLGTLVVDGPTTVFRVDGTATAAANGGNSALAFMEIGRAGGNGTVTVSGGARLEVLAASSATNGIGMNLGRDANSAGTLNIMSGAVVLLRSTSVAPDTAGETWNPFVAVGRDGNGTLSISEGGQLVIEGDAVSTPNHARNTNLYIGGSGNVAGGGKGSATVSGAGSAIRVTGADAFVGVGYGATANGTLIGSNEALVAATIMHVGSNGGIGVAKFDNASVELTGQYTGYGGQPGAALVIGFGVGSVGNVSAVNGTTIRIANSGANGGGVSLGGAASATGGDGSLTLSASSLVFDFPNSSAGMNVGRSGSGLLRLQNGSTVDLGNETLFVAREAGSDGTVIATGGSTITAGWVGIGRSLTGGGDGSDGGTGTMVLNGATLFAENVVIGTNGYLGGSAGSINVTGSVTNYGTFSPGSSPGTFEISGDYTAGNGSRMILEIDAVPGGGFLTDLVLFDAGAAVSFGESKVEFRFLGETDPESFEASGGFDIGTFLQRADGSGGSESLSPSLFAEVAFSASSSVYQITEFTYDPATGGFTVTAVPEPGTLVLMFGGLLLIAGVARRRLAAAV